MNSKYIKSLNYICIVFLLLSFTGCQSPAVRTPIPKEWLNVSYDDSVPNDNKTYVYSESKESTEAVLSGSDTISSNSSKTELMQFYDVFRNEYNFSINQAIKRCPYSLSHFTPIDKDLTGRQIVSQNHDFFSEYFQLPSGETMGYEGILKYEDEKYTSSFGVDVSKFQKNIDWNKAKSAGVEFAIIRAAYRGYGRSGSLNEDPYFRKNIEGAHNAGIRTGAYIYSQAVNEQEAIEEADFILKLIEGYDVDLPIVYDPESVLYAEARTDNVTPQQFTKNAKAFCKKIRESGYEPMIYSNMYWEAFMLDLSELDNVPIWYADYERYPQTPYNFKVWQYSQCGHIQGIPGNVDLNIMMIEK